MVVLATVVAVVVAAVTAEAMASVCVKRDNQRGLLKVTRKPSSTTTHTRHTSP